MPTVHAKMEKEVHSCLSGLASFETPKKIGLLGEDFRIENGELTPTLKVKRRIVEQNYKSLIDSLYARSEQVAAEALR
jgi:long-chain acyl-CoA synthetase